MRRRWPVAANTALATAGACAGFLPFNAHPASIFMGDGGALLLGLLMASASIAPLIVTVASAPMSIRSQVNRCSLF